jgi:hypothetical protein
MFSFLGLGADHTMGQKTNNRHLIALLILVFIIVIGGFRFTTELLIPQVSLGGAATNQSPQVDSQTG